MKRDSSIWRLPITSFITLTWKWQIYFYQGKLYCYFCCLQVKEEYVFIHCHYLSHPNWAMFTLIVIKKQLLIPYPNLVNMFVLIYTNYSSTPLQTLTLKLVIVFKSLSNFRLLACLIKSCWIFHVSCLIQLTFLD